jgi:hypothetical protein
MADMLAAKSAIQQAVVEVTNAKQARAWLRYQHYLYSIGCQFDPFLESFTRAQHHCILAAFSHAVEKVDKAIKITHNSNLKCHLGL